MVGAGDPELELARLDLLALTDDGLIQLANAGLVKRALREVGAGQGPTLEEAADGTIQARFSDGTATRLAPGRPPADASCTCPASGLCRHRVALVVAYRAASAALETAGTTAASSWDPSTLDSDAFEASLNAAAAAEVARLLAAGIIVGLDRGAVPAARLPAATVRFLVPGETGYARCDCAAGGGCAHVALAIRAFREAKGASEVRLGATAAKPTSDDLALSIQHLLSGLLEHGVVAGPAAHRVAIDRCRRVAEARGATQMLLAIGDLDGQLEAYDARDALYDEREVLALMTELHARTRVGDSAALGIGQPYETAMAKTRLVSLGARLRARGRTIVAHVVLADTDTGATLKFERSYAPTEGEPSFVANVTARQLAPGLALAAVAEGQILTSVARRRADGLLALGQGSRGRTALMPREPFVRLPAPLAATDVASVGRRLAERPMAMLRPRDRLGAVHVFEIGAVLGQAWWPGSQVWKAAVTLADDGGTLHLARTHDQAAPAALDALSAALGGHHGVVRQIAGPVWIEDGVLVCDPLSIAADRLVVPDFAAPQGPTGPVPAAPLKPERTRIEEAQALLAGALHTGRRAFERGAATGTRLATQLSATGHVATAARLSAWLGARENPAAPFAAAAIWIAAIVEDVEIVDPSWTA